MAFSGEGKSAALLAFKRKREETAEFQKGLQWTDMAA